MCSLADFPQKLSICQDPPVFAVIGFVDNGWLVGVLDCVPVDAIVRRIQLTLQEPRIIPIFEGARMDRLEIPLPCEELSSQSSPKLVRLRNRFFVQLPVLVET